MFVLLFSVKHRIELAGAAHPSAEISGANFLAFPSDDGRNIVVYGWNTADHGWNTADHGRNTVDHSRNTAGKTGTRRTTAEHGGPRSEHGGPRPEQSAADFSSAETDLKRRMVAQRCFITNAGFPGVS